MANGIAQNWVCYLLLINTVEFFNYSLSKINKLL